jgi:hypothetical protein
MKAKFHAVKVKGIEGGWELWAILITDSDGAQFLHERQIQGDHWSSIFHSRSEAVEEGEALAEQFFGVFTAETKFDHYLIPQTAPEPCCGTDLSDE